MDTSQEYINMSKKAVEIQKDWIPHDWDYVYGNRYPFDDKVDRDSDYKVMVLSGYETDGGFYGAEIKRNPFNSDIYFKGIENPIWLPRQDQLQAMIVQHQNIIIQQVYRMWFYWLEELDVKYYNSFNSLEQLWLIYVMHELYSKRWDGTDWIKHNP